MYPKLRYKICTTATTADEYCTALVRLLKPDQEAAA